MRIFITIILLHQPYGYLAQLPSLISGITTTFTPFTTSPQIPLKDEQTILFDFYGKSADEHGFTAIFFNLSEKIDLSTVTVCFWLTQLYNNHAQVMKLTSETADVYIFSEKDELMILVTDTVYKYRPFDFSNWNNICIDFSSMALKLNGKDIEANEEPAAEMLLNAVRPESSKNPKLNTIGGFLGPFEGMLTNILVSKQSMTEDDLELYRQCKLTNKSNVKITSARGNSDHTIFIVKNISYPCSETTANYIPVILYSICNASLANFVCNQFNSRMLSINDDYTDAFEEICKGITDSSRKLEVWLDSADSTCAKFVCNYDKITKEAQVLSVQLMPCSSTMNVVCMINKNLTISVRDDKVVPFTPLNFRGNLIFCNKEWFYFLVITLMENEEDLEMAYYEMSMEPYTKEVEAYSNILGRHKLKNKESKKEKRITATICSTKEFTCDNGECIPIDLRCNNRIDCYDESDEGSTCSAFDDIPNTYYTDICPDVIPKVNLTTEVITINSIDINKNEYSVLLKISMSWTDNRLTFLNLNNDAITTVADNSPVIWEPRIYFLKSIYSDNINIYSNTTALIFKNLKVIGKTRFRVKNSYEETEISGKDVSIIKQIKYQVTFICKFNLESYPFDVHVCKSPLLLLEGMGCEPTFFIDNGSMELKGKGDSVSMYSVLAPKIFYNGENNTANPIDLVFLISRNYYSQLLTTFGPCIALVYLGQITLLLFSNENFNERITVTLSLLIVVASIFSQVVSTLPDSSVSKYVDKFFFYCILRLSYTFVLHVLVDKSMRYIKNKREKADAITIVQNVKLDNLIKPDKDAWRQPGEAWGPVYIPEKQEADIKKKNKVNRCSRLPCHVNKIGFILGIVSDIIAVFLSYYSILQSNDAVYESFYEPNATVLHADIRL